MGLGRGSESHLPERPGEPGVSAVGGRFRADQAGLLYTRGLLVLYLATAWGTVYLPFSGPCPRIRAEPLKRVASLPTGLNVGTLWYFFLSQICCVKFIVRQATAGACGGTVYPLMP